MSIGGKHQILLLACVVFGTVRPVSAQDHRAIAVEKEVEHLARAMRLWPGFAPLQIPLAIYDGESTYLFRHPAPPEGFKSMTSHRGRVYVYTGRHPLVEANTSVLLGGEMSATLMIDRPDSSLDPTGFAAIALHEAFHVFQRRRHPGWQANEAELFIYPTDDPELLALRRRETEALRRAVGAQDEPSRLCWSRRALVSRDDRFSRIDSAMAAYERKTELNEGLAAYVQMRAAGRETVDLPPAGFDAEGVRQRAYATGPAIAVVLDRTDPGWRDALEANDAQYLDKLLKKAIDTRQPDPPVACQFSEVEAAQFDRAARADVAEVLSRRASRRNEFEARPGWRVVITAPVERPLWPQGFDPLNVHRVDGGILHTRFLRAGNDSGRVEIIDSSGADLESLTEGVGPHPLFNGITRVVVTGLSEPEVQVDDRSVTIHAHGLEGRFESATVDHRRNEIVIQLD